MSSITVREAITDADLEAWARVKRAVLPNESAWTPEQFRSRAEPTRRVTIAELDGEVVGCGLGGRSDMAGRSFLTPRVHPDFRRRGVGTALLRDLVEFARTLPYPVLVAYGDDVGSKEFAERFGFVETDRQVEQVLVLNEPVELSPIPDGLEVVTIEQRPELLEAAHPLALLGFEDFALDAQATISLHDWLEEEATLPGGSFVALQGEQIVGYSGLMDHDSDGIAEDGLTVVTREWRGKGLAKALKQRELEWARTHGIREVVTWTQKGNESMRRTNERLGYVYRDVSLTMTVDRDAVINL